MSEIMRSMQTILLLLSTALSLHGNLTHATAKDTTPVPMYLVNMILSCPTVFACARQHSPNILFKPQSQAAHNDCNSLERRHSTYSMQARMHSETCTLMFQREPRENLQPAPRGYSFNDGHRHTHQPHLLHAHSLRLHKLGSSKRTLHSPGGDATNSVTSATGCGITSAVTTTPSKCSMLTTLQAL